MKVNSLLSDIFRSEWLFDPHSVLLYAPVLANILGGDGVIGESTKGSLLFFNDKNGRPISPGDDIPKGSIAHVYMVGPVMKYGDSCSYGGDEMVASLRIANANPNVKGIVFHIDGPGGAVSAISPFLQFAQEKTKPVIGLADAAMSLHYWTAIGVCDYVIADNNISARFGSVGVVSTFLDTRGALEQKGYKLHEIYPDESKHKNEAFNLALQGKYDMIKKEHLSPLAQKFQAAVIAARPNLKAKETGVLTGKTFTAEESLAYGMIDAIGSLDTALERIDILTEIKQFKSVNN